jgi:hypothetical protein
VCNSIDDDGVKVLLKSLEEHPSLAHLDLSHNRISNAGYLACLTAAPAGSPA